MKRNTDAAQTLWRAFKADVVTIISLTILAAHMWLLTGTSVFADDAALDQYLWEISAGPLLGRLFTVGMIAIAIMFSIKMVMYLISGIAKLRTASPDVWSPRIAGILASLVFGVGASTFAVQTAAAQYGGATEVVCSAGGEKLFSLAIGAVALYYTAKGGLKVMSGVDDKKSRSSMKQKEGNEKFASGVKTMGMGIFGPGLIAAGLDYLGVSLGCLSFDIGILVIAAPV